MHDQIWVVWIIGLEMDGIVVFPVHARVHHEDRGFHESAFAGFECHRTDGQFGGSASLQDFDVWLSFESKQAVAAVGDLDLELPALSELDISVVNGGLISGDSRRPIDFTSRISLDGNLLDMVCTDRKPDDCCETRYLTWEIR